SGASLIDSQDVALSPNGAVAYVPVDTFNTVVAFQTSALPVFHHGSLQFSAATYMVNENAGKATVTVTRSGGTDGTVAVTSPTGAGPGVPGPASPRPSGTPRFPNGQTSASFDIPTPARRLTSGTATINLTLSNPQGFATLGPQTTATVTILHN